jgi:putative peptidoglycan lipid II flippase
MGHSGPPLTDDKDAVYPSAEREVKEAGPSLARQAGLISAMTFLSRILGLIREQVFAALLGAGFHADAFNTAFRVPNLLRDLFAEGALSAAFVPTYTRTMAEGGRPAGFALASRLLSLLAVVLGVLVVLGWLFARPLVAWLAPGFEAVPGKADLTVQLTRLMLPFLPLVSFAAVAMGMLNAHERFGSPAFAPAAFNVVSIVWAVGLWAAGFGPATVALGWAVGTLLGGLAQFLVQVPGLVREGWRPRLEWAPGDPGIRRVAQLMGPATVGLAAVQINIFVSTRFASSDQGAIACLQYAFRVLYLPIGIFGVAVGTVVTTSLARRAAADDLAGMRNTLARALRLLAFLTLPATAGLLVLSTPIVRLLYQRGRFDAQATATTAAALAFYAVGLIAYTGVKVLAPAFYALGRPRVPLLASALAVLTNLVFLALCYRSLGFRAVALGTALGSLVNGAILAAAFERSAGGLVRGIATSATAKMVLASAVMAVPAWLAARALERAYGTSGLFAQLATGLGPVIVGGVVYLLASWLLRIPEAASVWGVVQRRAARP